MPFQKLQFRPGVIRDVTGYTNEGGWFDCNLVRFRLGFPESIGGWEKLSSSTFLGSARTLLAWVTLNGNNYLSLGTNLKFYVERGGAYNDITPIRRTVVLNGAFVPYPGLSIVDIFDVSHGCVDGDFVTFSGATSLGGNVTAAVLNAEYQITYLTPDSYRITVPVTANGSDTGNGGASITAAYQINTGLDTQVGGIGWGSGTFSTLLSYTLSGPFTTSSASAVVTVTHTSHGLSTGQYVSYSAASSVGGIPASALQSTFQVTVLNANSYTITTTSTATSIATGGGTVTAFYQNGSRAWGSGTTISVGNSLRLWSQDNYGEDLLFNVRNGGVYYWYGGGSITTRAVTLSSLSTDLTTPDVVTQIMVSDRDRHVIAFGSNMGGGGSQDPLLVRFSDGEDPFTWYPSATNTAGDLRIGSGTKIVKAVETKREIVIFSDTAVYSMQYLGPPYTFGLQQLAANTTIMGYNSAVAVDDAVFWMGHSNFYVYAGQTQPLNCPIQSYVFEDFNEAQSDKVFAYLTAQFNEVSWLYPSANSSENDRYVTYNYIDKVWSYGILARTAWLDDGVRTYPIAASTDGYLYNHEYGTDDGSTNPASPISAYIETSPFDIGEGDKFSFVRRIIPDLKFFNSTDSPQASLVLKTQNYNGSSYASGSTSSVTRTASVPIDLYTNVANVRVRGRSMIFRIESNKVGTRWGLGSPRIELRTDGGR